MFQLEKMLNKRNRKIERKKNLKRSQSTFRKKRRKVKVKRLKRKKGKVKRLKRRLN